MGSVTARNKALFAAFATVETNGQAVAFGLRAARHARLMAEDLASYIWDIAAQRAVRDLNDYIGMINTNLKPFANADVTAPVAASSWKVLKANIGGMYALTWGIEDVLSADARDTFLSLVADITVDAVKAVPKIIQGAVSAAGEVVGAAGAGVGSALGNVLKGTWPILLVAAVVGVAALVVTAKVKA